MSERHAPRTGKAARGAPRTRGLHLAVVASALLALMWADGAQAQAREGGSKARAGQPPARQQPAEEGPRWSQLTRAQRAALQPLAPHWSSVDAVRKQQWIEIADRYDRLPPDEQARIQERMATWSALTPQQRGRARQQFQEARRMSPEERVERWDAYQALPPEKRDELADKAAKNRRPSKRAAPGSARPEAARSAGGAAGGQRAGKETPAAAKTSIPNVIVTPVYNLPPKPVGPTIVQVRPGATTALMSRRPAPAPQREIVLPKMTGTPEFVDSNTLLPRRPTPADGKTSRGSGR